MLHFPFQSHTIYHVGLTAADPHIQYFWTILESLSQSELCLFIKFACNQERIPHTCICKHSGDSTHVPPYPMKIAPPDGQGKFVVLSHWHSFTTH